MAGLLSAVLFSRSGSSEPRVVPPKSSGNNQSPGFWTNFTRGNSPPTRPIRGFTMGGLEYRFPKGPLIRPENAGGEAPLLFLPDPKSCRGVYVPLHPYPNLGRSWGQKRGLVNI